MSRAGVEAGAVGREVGLSGCAFIGAPGRRARRQTHAIVRDLRITAPPEWLTYLDGR